MPNRVPFLMGWAIDDRRTLKKPRLLTDHFFQFGSLLVEVWLHGSNRVHHNGFKYLRIGLVGSRGPRILIGTVHGFPLSPRILNATVSNFRGFLTARFCTISTDSKRFSPHSAIAGMNTDEKAFCKTVVLKSLRDWFCSSYLRIVLWYHFYLGST